jgi:hypothetical protein
VDLSDVAWLQSDDGRAVVNGLPPYRSDEVLEISGRLRAEGVSPAHAAAALTQSRLRARAASRWGSAWAARAHQMLFTSTGAEQTTRPAVAALRAERYGRLELGSRVADVGCGIGTDSIALAQRGLSVDAFEHDPVTAAVAAANFRALMPGREPSVTTADVIALSTSGWTRYRGIYADPARRRGDRRTKNPEQWSPPLAWVLALPIPDLGVKVAPGLDQSLVSQDTEIAVVSDAGEVVEAGLYRGSLREVGITRSATLLPSHLTLTNRDLPRAAIQVRAVGQYLHEPDAAVIRAGLVAAIADRSGGWLIDPQIAYFSSDELTPSGFASSYHVHAVLPFSLKTLRAHLRENDVGHVVIKKRGSAVDIDTLHRSLRLKATASAHRTVMLTRIGHDPIVIVTTPAE